MSTVASEPHALNLQAHCVAGNPGIASSPFHIRGTSLGHPTVTAFTIAAVVPAAALINGFLTLAPNAPGVTYTLPTAVDLVAAFVTSGSPLAIGDVFEVKFQNTLAVTCLFAVGVGIVAATALETIPSRRAGVLIFRVTGAAALTVAQSISSA